MFELVLNAVKLAVSSEFRSSAGALLELLTSSPEWKNDFVTMEARVTKDFEERLDLVIQVVGEKMQKLAYWQETIADFRISVSELATNAFVHAVESEKDVVSVSIDISNTYVSAVVSNPKGEKVYLDKWLARAARHLNSTEKKYRGRGLITVCRRADTTSKFGFDGVKVVFYRERVNVKVFEDQVIPSASSAFTRKLIVAVSGHTNPSFGRRMVDYIRHHATPSTTQVIVVLDPREIVASPYVVDWEFSRRIKETLLAGVRVNRVDGIRTGSMTTIITFIDREFAEGELVIVCSDPMLRDLLPVGFVVKDIGAVIDKHDHFRLIENVDFSGVGYVDDESSPSGFVTDN